MLSSVPDEEQFFSGERSSHSWWGEPIGHECMVLCKGGDPTAGRRQGAM
jgi:hypothetical protein